MARLTIEKSLKKEIKTDPIHIGDSNKSSKFPTLKINLTH
jgi:hypothetical protein